MRSKGRREIERLTHDLQQAYQSPHPAPELDEIAQELEEAADVLAECWPALPEPEKRLIVNGLVEAIEVVVDYEPGRRRYERAILAVRLRQPFRS